VDREPGSTSGSLESVGDLFTALRRQGLIADELVLQLATFLRSLDLFLELSVWTPRTLTAYQVRHCGKKGTDNPELSRIHFPVLWPALTSTAVEPPPQRLTISFGEFIRQLRRTGTAATLNWHVRYHSVSDQIVATPRTAGLCN
jgi:hypothetical protein